MKLNWQSICALSVIIFTQSVWADEIKQPNPIPPESEQYTPPEGTIKFKYNKQVSITCNGKEFKIPPYFAYLYVESAKNKIENMNLYLVANEHNCNENEFSMGINLGDNCNGQSSCSVAGFSYSRVSDLVWSNIGNILYGYFNSVKIGRGLYGHFIPAKCYASCGMGQLIWYDRKKKIMYSIETHNTGDSKEVIDKMVESANSYINTQ